MADYDLKRFKETVSHVRDMEMNDYTRNNMFAEMESMYWMRWDEEAAVTDQMRNVKVTRTPLARNSIIGAIRLMTATDPVISVPHDINKPENVQKASKIEKFLKAVWFGSGRIYGDPLHYDVVRSGLIYGEIVIAINSTKDMAQMSTIPAVKRRMDDISRKIPYLFEVWSPKNCNTERDKFGVTSFHRKIDTNVGHILDVYGKDGEDALRSNKNKKEMNRNDTVTFHMFYDLRDICLWMDGYDKPIKMEEHGLPFIPIVSQIVEGSSFFGKDYHRQEPFLYTLSRSKLVERQNLMLTTLYTMLFSIGANPMFVDFTVNPEDAPEADYSEPGGVIHYRVGESRQPMAKQIIDPTLMQGWEISQDLEAQSTIYKQTLGEPLGSNAPYSMVALLSQSGRLPLISTQRKAGWAIGEAMEIALKWMKSDGITASARFEEYEAELEPGEIPEDINVDVHLDINMPTDKLQAANAANMLTQGENPMVSNRWARENILDIGQSEDMTKEIWNERTANIFYEKFIYEQMVQLAQMKQMAMMPGNMGGMPGAPAGQAPMPPSPEMPAPPQQPQGAPPQRGTPPAPQSPEAVEPQEPYPPMPPMSPMPPPGE